MQKRYKDVIQGQSMSLDFIHLMFGYKCASPAVSKEKKIIKSFQLKVVTVQSIKKPFTSDALYSLSGYMLLTLPTKCIPTHTHTHTTQDPFRHLKSDSPSRISWPSPPWRISCGGPSYVRTSSWRRPRRAMLASPRLLRVAARRPGRGGSGSGRGRGSNATAAPPAPLPPRKQLPHPGPLHRTFPSNRAHKQQQQLPVAVSPNAGAH